MLKNASVREDDSLDRAFFHCLKEIEITYTCLPKSLRLRVEKWVEKFITVGYNPVWKKNRNMYAKLLLSMIISKKLTDPFHVSPEDGQPLPPFPSYLIPKFKSALGPHESFFWRNIFDRISEPVVHTRTPQHFSPYKREESAVPPVPTPDYVKLDPTQKETYNLRLLMKEQAKRIEIMEEQMHQERLKHERDIQQVLQQSREESDHLKQLYQSNRAGYSSRNSSITSSNPYEIYDRSYHGSGRKKSPVQPTNASNDFERLSQANSYQNKHHRSPNHHSSPRPINDSFMPDCYQCRHRENNGESHLNQDFSVGVPVFTPGKDKSTYGDTSPHQKTPLRSASKNVYFRENEDDIKPSSINYYGKGEAKDIFALPKEKEKADISPRFEHTTAYERINSLHANHGVEKLSESRSSSPLPEGAHYQSPVKSNGPFAKEEIWPNYYQSDLFDTKSDTTYNTAKKTINKIDSNVAPILRRDVPEDEGEFMTYLEDFQREIRELQFNTAHNKGL